MTLQEALGLLNGLTEDMTFHGRNTVMRAIRDAHTDPRQLRRELERYMAYMPAPDDKAACQLMLEELERWMRQHL